MQELKLLTLSELASILGRNPETIRKDLRRNPDAVPPRLQLPGTRLLRWRAIDVESWLASNVQNGGSHV
jgi:predicted DNA-binding transcriptional regulator AlpA